MNSDERAAIADEVRRTVRDIPDFPKPGILFRDITPVLANPLLFGRAMMAIASPFEGQGITHVVSIESRGFIRGGRVALLPLLAPPSFFFVLFLFFLGFVTYAREIHAEALRGAKGVRVVDD